MNNQRSVSMLTCLFQPARSLTILGRCLLVLTLALLAPAGAALADQPTNGDLKIETLTAYNFIVDSNVGSPSTYGPGAATIGAKFCNTGANPLTNVVAYIGNYGTGRADGTGNTPGSYPVRDSDADGTGDGYPNDTELTTDSRFTYIKNTGEYAFKHQGGNAGSADATRYVGTIPAGGCVTQYWTLSYPRCKNTAANAGPPYDDEPPCGANNTVTGDIKPDDDLWLEYDIWATASDSGSPLTAWDQRKATMRNEISAMANKIWPNGDNKVPTQYKEAIEEVLGWHIGDGGAITPYPGQTTITEGIWYDLGNIEHGFDNDGDLVPDQNAWLQPVGDPSLVDAGCFRLVRTYGLIIVKLVDGGELLIPFVDQLYFENLPKNNGAVGLIYYEYMAVGGGCSSSLTPYQEVASGFDNEKFNGDYGTSGGTLTSLDPTAEIVKDVDKATVTPGPSTGGDLTYTVTFSNTSSVPLGRPDLGMPLVISDSIPTGTTYIAGSATANNTLPAGVSSYTVLYSTDHGVTWTNVEPAANLVTDLQWWLSDPIPGDAEPVGAPYPSGIVRFKVNVPSGYSKKNILNTAYLSFGGVNPFDQDDALTLIPGTNSLGDRVWTDDGTGGGTLGDGLQNGTEASMSGVTVNLYYDADNSGTLNAGDYLYDTKTTTAANPNYLFSNLPDGKYIVEVDKSTVTQGYANTTPGSTETADYVYLTADLDSLGTNPSAVSNLTRDFGFAPALTVNKFLSGGGTTIYADNTVTYTLRVKNNLPGSSGTPLNGNTQCEYTAWATARSSQMDTGNKGYFNPDGVTQPASVFYNPSEPDDIYAYGDFTGFDYEAAATGFSLGTGVNGTTGIAKIEGLYKYYMASSLVNDFLTLRAYMNGSVLGTTLNVLPAELNTHVGQANVTTRAWDFTAVSGRPTTVAALANLDLEMLNNKSGAGDGGRIYLDTIGVRVTTSAPCPSSGTTNTIIDPAPVVDTYDADYLEFVSASPPIDGASVDGATGTLTWDNVGPLAPGATKDITVVFKAKTVTSTVNPVNNTVTVDQAKFQDGRDTNDGTATVAVALQPTGKVSGYVWSDVATTGWLTGTSTGYGAGDGFFANVTVRLYTCVDINTGQPLSPDLTTNSCATTNGRWEITGVTTTNDNGYYEFKGVRDGFHYTKVDTTTIPGTPTQTADVNVQPGTCGASCDSQSNTGTETFGVSTYKIRTKASDGLDDITNINFGYTAQTGIYGNVWKDYDGNGTRDAIDVDFSGVTVTLYQSNCTTQVGTSVTTNAAGDYAFTGLTGGTQYCVKIGIPDGYQITDETDAAAGTAGNTDNRILATPTTGDMSGSHDFGLHATGTASIGDTVYWDWDGDGVYDAGADSGIPNITVNLYQDLDGDGVIDATDVLHETQVTDASGAYLFSTLPAGNFIVKVDTDDADFALGTPQQTGDPDATKDSKSTQVVATGASYLNHDFGYQPSTGSAQLGDTVYWDVNTNGQQDGNEPGVAGVTLTLYKDVNGDGDYDAGTDTFVATQSTDSTGTYLFTGLYGDADGEKYVVVVQTSGSPLNGAAQSGDPEADGVSCAGNATLCNSQGKATLYASTSYMGADFGYDPAGVTNTIGDYLWLDTDGDGAQDASEFGIPYVTVNLTGPGCSPCTTVTDADGYYVFTSLADGTYTVTVDNADADFPSGVTPTHDRDGTGTPHTAGSLSVSGGQSILDADFGYTYTGSASLSGTVCRETTADGLCNGANDSGVGAGETAFVSIPVYLYKWNDDGDSLVEAGETTLIGQTTTAANGDYGFTGIPDSRYVVSTSMPLDNLALTTTAATAGHPADNVVKTPASGATASAYATTPPISGSNPDYDFAYQSTVNYDYGDLPDSFGTTFNEDGARHIVSGSPTLYLGTAPDTETDGAPSVAADGDGADENGVSFNAATWTEGTNGGSVTVNVTGSGWLVGWIDFDGNGSFDAGETLVNQAVSTNASLSIDFDIPAGAFATTNGYARFRLFPEQPTFPTLSYVGEASGGEVEDYRIDLARGVIGDRVWLDENGDGVQDAGEDGIAGVTVWADYDNNGSIDTGEPSAVTDAHGNYLLTDVPAGTYAIKVKADTLPAGLTNITYDEDSGTTSPNGATSVVLPAGGAHLSADFGYNYAPPGDTDTPNAASTGAIGDRLWFDADGDGVQDAGEAGIVGVTVKLLVDSNGDGTYGGAGDTAAVTTTTGADGRYVFDGLSAGGYVVQVDDTTLPAGLTQTGDPDATLDHQTTGPIVLGPGDVYVNADFGYRENADTYYDIGDRVFVDSDHDGIDDGAATEPGIPGVTVVLKNGSGQVIATDVTDAAGNYLFQNLPNGASYTVVVTDTANVLGGYTQTADPSQPGAVCTTCDSQSSVALSGADRLDQDFGYVPIGHAPGYGLIGDTVFLDRDGDNAFDNGEGLAGVIVQLYDGTGDYLIAETTTAENGFYVFGGLDAASSYIVQVDTLTLPGGGAGLTNTVDPDTANPGDSQSFVDLWADADGIDLAQDFGYVPTVPNSIGGTLWRDSDADGLLEGGEAGRFEGVTVILRNSQGYVVGTTTTDAGGNFSFGNLPDGDYTVDVATGGALTGYWHSLGGTPGADDNSQLDPYSVSVSGGETDTTADFGYYNAGALIGDLVWHDVNADGDNAGDGETGIASIRVTLTVEYPGAGSTTLYTVTDGSGLYAFGNLLLDEDYTASTTGTPAGSTPRYTVSVGTAPANMSSTHTVATDTAEANNLADNPAGDYATIVKGGEDRTNDFGYASGSIGDTVWNDLDGNGAQDIGEPGLDNVRVYLDANDNNAFDPLEQNVLTAGGGLYVFNDLAAGTYPVRIDTATLPAGYQPTYDLDGGDDHEASVLLLAGENRDDVDFGYQQQNASIGDYVWNDADNDGVQDGEESGIDGVTVRLWRDNDNDGLIGGGDTDLGVETTNGGGLYSFTGLPAGDYLVEVTDIGGALAGYNLTGGTEPHDVTLTAGLSYDTADFGYYQPPLATASIGDRVWNDLDGDGVQDDGETNLAGVRVYLDLDGDNAYDAGDEPTATTDANGLYTIGGLTAGTYTARIDTSTLAAGFIQTYDLNGGLDHEASVTLNAGDALTTVDFGYWQPASLGDRVWNDTNGDGVQDGGESGLGGILVHLTGAGPDNTFGTADDIDYPDQTTDGNGAYAFGDLPAGQYRVDPVGPNGYGLTTGNDPLVVILAAGEAYDTADFGYRPAGAIGNRVWLDEDGDGVQDAGEAGIPNLKVELYDATGTTLIATTTTDAEGGYLFGDVPAGVGYKVVVTPAAGLNPTYDEDGTGTANASLTPVIAAGVEHLTADFGYNWVTPTDTNDPGPGTTGAIGDRLWLDADGDGAQDAGEAGLSGVTVRLLTDDNGDGTYGGAGDNPATTATTDGYGQYLFDGLPAGAYVVAVDGASLPAGVTQTGDPDGTLDGRTTDAVVLAPGDVYVNADFGYQPSESSTIGDRVYLDADADGSDDGVASEPGIPGVSVALVQDLDGDDQWDAGEPVIATDLTDASGLYGFPGLPAGDYLVVVTDTAHVLGELAQTGDPDGGNDGRSAVSVDGVDDNLLQDFGYAPEGHEPGEGLIGDTVFLDRDGDGLFDAGEGLEGVTVGLYDGASLLATTVTDENGRYGFGGLDPAGAYEVVVDDGTLPNGGVGLTNTVDPDAGLAHRSTVDLGVSGPVDLDQDFGYEADQPNTIAGTVWNDRDADGSLDEPGRLQGVTVELRDGFGNVVATTTTDASGDYSFQGLPNGTYTVDVTDTGNVLDGYWHSLGSQNPATDNTSKADPFDVAVSGGETNSNIDFGYYSEGAALGNRVWSDTDGDGLQEAGEPGLPNVPVTLVIGYPNGASTTVVAVSDGTGGYRFGNLLLDENFDGQGTGEPTYELRAVTPPANYTATLVGQGSSLIDSNDHTGATATVTKGQTDTTVQADPATEPANASYDFGYEPPPGTVTVSGTVFHDLSQDKLQDGDEPGTNVSGQLYVTAVDNGTPVETVPVGPDGTYSVLLPSNASYTLVLSTNPAGSTTPDLPAGWSNTGENRNGTVDPGAGDGLLSVTVAYVPVGGQNFGIDGEPPHADDDSAVTPHDTNVDLTILANDDLGPGGTSFDPATIDLDPSSPAVDTSYTIPDQGTYTVNPATGVVTFDPLPTFGGPTTPIPYLVKDDLGQPTNEALITVVVGPLANDDAETTPYNTPLNDTVVPNDVYPEGSTFTQIGPEAPGTTSQGGQVTLNPDGSYTYTPPPGFTGIDTFHYEVCLAAPNETLCDPATVTITVQAQPPELRIVKTVSQSQPAVGAPFIYTLTITNSGGTATDPEVIDTVPAGVTITAIDGGAWTCAPSSALPLAGGPGATVTCSRATLAAGSDTITLTAVATADTGSLVNYATVTGDDDTPPVTPTPGNCAGGVDQNCDQATVEPRNPRIELIKEVTLLEEDETGTPDGQAQAGEELTYTFTITNRGDVDLVPVTLVDPQLNGGSLNCNAQTTLGNPFSLGGTLVPTDSVVCAGKHTVTAAEDAADRIENVATATGKAPDQTPVQSTATGLWDNTPPPGQPVRGQISLAKTAVHNDGDGDGAFDSGETVTYGFVVRNVGTTALSNVTVTDNTLGLTVNCPATELTVAPAAGSQMVCTATADYTLLPSDVANGYVLNTATVNGTDPSDNPVVDTDDKLLNSREPAALELKKTAVLTTDQGLVGLSEGDTLTYTLVATNTGAVALTNVTITDGKLGTALNAEGACSPSQGATLNPGEQMVCAAPHVVQVGETNPIDNTAHATGKPVGRREPLDASGNHVVPYQPTPAPVYTVGNRVWLDADNNGVMGQTETGIDGVVARLLRCTDAANVATCAQARYEDDSPIADQVTAAGGYYQFADVPENAGQFYRVQVLPLNFKSDGNGTKPLYGAISSQTDAANFQNDGRDQGIGSTPSATNGTLSRGFDLSTVGTTTFEPVDFGFVRKTVTTAPDLVITNTASAPTVSRGGTLSYTLQASNAVGAGSLTKAPVITDTLPSGMTVATGWPSVQPTGWKCTVGSTRRTLTCAYLGALPIAGGGQLGGEIVIPVGVGASTATGVPLASTATITKLTGEPSFTNNTATATVTVNP
jgi:uncharacterized repeat protein (TIGR01451 family)